jgi:tetratricopeptide (TPR) repeat protein
MINSSGLSLARDRMYLASAYIMQGSLIDAEEQLNKVAKISQNTYLGTNWLRNWGNLCLQTNNLKKAKEINSLLESRIYQQNELDKANHSLLSGNIMILSDSIEEGIELLESALILSKNGYSKGYLANAYFKLDRASEKAEMLYKEIIRDKEIGWEAQEFFIMSYIRLAEIYESRGQTEESITYYEKFLRLWKDADKEILLKSQVLDKIEQYNIKLR